MFKNTASQKLTFFAFDYSTGAPKTGDAANITVYVQIDDGTVTALTDTSASELDSTNAKGSYVVDLTQAETNGNKLVFTGKSSTSNVAIVPQTIYTVPAAFGIAGGSSGGVMIAGTNAALTVTGAVQFQNAFNITGALTVGGGIDVVNSTTNGPAVTLLGNGTGEAIKATAGATGKAVSLISVANHSLFIKAVGSYKHGVHVESDTDGNAICFQATHTDVTSSTHFGHGMVGFSADVANGNAVMLRALYHGCGLALYGYDNEAGFHIQGGATGRGIYIGAGATSGVGVDIVSTATAFRATASNGDAMQLTAGGTGSAAVLTAGTDGHGMSITGGATAGNNAIYAESQSGDCLRLTVSTLGHAINATAAGSSRHGLRVQGGSAGTSDGALFVAGTGGVGMRVGSFTCTGAAIYSSTVAVASTFTVTGGIVAAITGDVTGNLSGKVQGSIVAGTVTTGASTTSIPTSSLSPAASVADQFKGRIVIFDKTTTTTALRGQATDITASSSGGTLTVTALTTAPSSGDTFTIY